MKGRKHEHKHPEGAKHRADGGMNDADADLKDKPEEYNHSRVESEAEERKRGGKAKRKRGGHAHEHMKKHVGEVHGEAAKHHAGKKPRKSGGRANATASPYSSAKAGHEPAGRETDGSVEC